MERNNEDLRVLVACEESQAVCSEFRKRGIKAFSCDLQPCSGGHEEWHLQVDALQLLKLDWDMIIAHPPCTFLTVTGNRWFNVERYGEKAIERARERERAAAFFLEFANCNCAHVAIENPIGYMNSHYAKPSQIIQPWQFGDPYEKKTCLWLRGLPKLNYTEIVEPEPRIVWKSGKSGPAWYYSVDPKNRSLERSKTFPGIARAMAEQWGDYLLNSRK